MSITIAFMFKPGHALEEEALLLAASVRRHVQGDVALDAFCEESDMAWVDDTHRAWLDRLEVRLRPLNPEGLFRGRYPQGNKIALCNADFDTDRVIFLDSDMAFTAPTDLVALTGAPLVLTPSLGANWGRKGNWDAVYRLFGVDPAGVARWGGGQMPYYNAGLVSFSRASGFARAWLTAAQRIDAAEDVPAKRPWLDQIALPLVPHAGGPGVTLCDSALYNRRPVRGALDDTRLVHYTKYHFQGSGLAERADDILTDRLGTGWRAVERQRVATRCRQLAGTTGDRPPFAKVFGERNTGTNLISQILAENYRVEQPREPSDGPRATAFTREALGPEDGPLFAGDMTDAAFLHSGLGWKHATPPLEVIEASPLADQTLFVCVWKDPFFWLKSMHRRPYQPRQRYLSDLSFSDFIRAPFETTARDRVSLPEGAVALDVYQEKLRGYLRLKQRFGENVLLVPYEHMITHQEQFLTALSVHAARGVRLPVFPSGAAKRKDVVRENMTTRDYLRKYSPEQRLAGLSGPDVEFIEGRVDRAVFDALDAQAYYRSDLPPPPFLAGLRRRLERLVLGRRGASAR